MKQLPFDLFIVLVSAIVINKGKILLLLRSKNNKTYRDFWQLPEGKLEEDEQPKEALKRELTEELGWEVNIGRILTASTTSLSYDGHKLNLTRIVFKVRSKEKISLSTDHDKTGWFDIEEAIKIPNLVPGLDDLFISLKPIL